MKEFVEKLIGRLEELPTKGIDRYKGGSFGNWEGKDYFIKQNDAIEIVKQFAKEYNNGWIPASEPPKCFMLSDGRLIPFLVCDKLMWHPYIAFYNGKEWFTASEKLNPTAYMPLPPAYVQKEGRE